MIVSTVSWDFLRQFASANSCGEIPLEAASLFNVSAFLMVYGSQPAGESQISGCSEDASADTGSVAVEVKIIVGAVVDSTMVGEGSGAVGVKMLTLSSIGNESIEVERPASVNASRKLPRTIAIDRPAASPPRMTLLRPKIPFFTQVTPSLEAGKSLSGPSHP
jgi:hypothetical protein